MTDRLFIRLVYGGFALAYAGIAAASLIWASPIVAAAALFGVVGCIYMVWWFDQ